MNKHYLVSLLTFCLALFSLVVSVALLVKLISFEPARTVQYVTRAVTSAPATTSAVMQKVPVSPSK